MSFGKINSTVADKKIGWYSRQRQRLDAGIEDVASYDYRVLDLYIVLAFAQLYPEVLAYA